VTAEPLATIVAPATPVGRSALAIVRMDGPASGRILGELASRAEESFPERRVTRVLLRADGSAIDDCVVIRYVAPHSFTGNDMVELITHGAPVVVEALIRAAVARGARIAEPGEFSERAVLNGKLDLVQAEAVGDLIAARTTLQARLSLRNLEGRLSGEANRVRGDLLHVISRLEAALDFAEEGYEFITREEAVQVLASAKVKLESIGATFRRGRAATAGLSLVIVGKPNVGKSSLLNFLVGSERAIVTDIPGTTRDLLRETVEIGGLPVTLVDTAGLRSTDEPVELIGVERARQAASGADLVLYLIDASRGADDEDLREITAVDPVVVHTKVDLAAAPEGALAISVRSGEGVDKFLEVLDRRVREGFAPAEADATVVNARQHGSVIEAAEALSSAVGALEEGRTEEVVLVDLYRAATALGLLTGSISSSDVLHEIFAKFCIGK
jgi:tRNA modification GTPase